jgi:hypothetical protein
MTRMPLALAAATLIAAVVVADGGAPQHLSETGLFALGRTGDIAAGVRSFTPQYPLWTDGAAKRRWVYLPPGATIAAADAGAWQVPVGTRLWKQFDFNGRKVETRMIWRAAPDRWVFASYQWNDDGTDAVLVPADGAGGVVEVAPGRRHSIPSLNDCTACHGAERPGPLGFNALQLSPDRDPAAIHGEPLQDGDVTLATLMAEHRLEGADRGLVASPPRIRTANPRTRSALGYLLANCGACHNGRGEIAALGPTLKIGELLHDGDGVARRLIAQPTRWQVPGVAEGESVLIDPARLEKSAMLVRMRSRSPLSQMPPLGTVLRDTEAVERLAAWAAEVGSARSRITSSGPRSRH